MEGAIDSCNRGLVEFPGDANLICLAARANLALQKLDESRALLDRVILQFPEFSVAQDVLGDLYLVEGKAPEALQAYEKSISLGANRKLALQKIAKARELLDSNETQTESRPEMAFADKIAEAEQYEKDGKRKEAETIYRDILKRDPDHVEASRLLAGIAVGYEQYQEAKVFLLHALELAPDYLRAMVELAPENPESYMVYASVVGVAGRHEEAIDAFSNALALNPEKAGALCGMAHHLKTIGRQEEAIARYRECIAIKPDHCEAYWSLANLKTFRFQADEIRAMHALLENPDLEDEGRAQIHNALGLEYEAQKDFDQAFENFSLCNLARRKAEFYDPVDTEDTHDRVINIFNKKFLQQKAGPELSPIPIFVVGLPRSGSTLIEQILASHSMVDGTHELSDLSKVVRALRRGKRREKRFPEVLEKLDSEGWARIGQHYLDRTAKHRGCAAFFIDKNPNNFVFTGLLKLAMPNARIINARRHPLDSCLGSFKQLFASGQPFTYDMTELAEYYLQYQRLMDHWHEVLPGFVLDVHYEDVVSDLDGQVARILAYCGLPFEESCLRFHETDRAVKTASSEQVRQPIYSSSVNLWRNYEHHLGTFTEILQPIL
jgi:tetratricopeptide (TPR) repeat protein